MVDAMFHGTCSLRWGCQCANWSTFLLRFLQKFYLSSDSCSKWVQCNLHSEASDESPKYTFLDHGMDTPKNWWFADSRPMTSPVHLVKEALFFVSFQCSSNSLDWFKGKFITSFLWHWQYWQYWGVTVNCPFHLHPTTDLWKKLTPAIKAVTSPIALSHKLGAAAKNGTWKLVKTNPFGFSNPKTCGETTFQNWGLTWLNTLHIDFETWYSWIGRPIIVDWVDTYQYGDECGMQMSLFSPHHYILLPLCLTHW